MSDISVRSDNVDVEQLMRQIRARIREKRGVDYTEDEIRELANVKLEQFLDPRGVRSDLLRQYQQSRGSSAPQNYEFDASTLFGTHRPLLRFIRRLLNPVLKLFFNPNPLIEALHIQSRLNAAHNIAEPLQYEIVHNLVVELTRTTIETKNLKMRLESIASRLDFDERRARALEGVVQYRPGTASPQQPPTSGASELDNNGAERRTRRRRRRGRRHTGGPDQGAAVEPAGDAEPAGEGRQPSDIPAPPGPAES